MEAGILRYSPVSPIQFEVSMSGVIKSVEEWVSGVEFLSIMNKIKWVATGCDVNHVVKITEPAPK